MWEGQDTLGHTQKKQGFWKSDYFQNHDASTVAGYEDRDYEYEGEGYPREETSQDDWDHNLEKKEHFNDKIWMKPFEQKAECEENWN